MSRNQYNLYNQYQNRQEENRVLSQDSSLQNEAGIDPQRARYIDRGPSQDSSFQNGVFIIPNSGSPFQNGLRGETFSVRDLGGREYNPQIGVQNEFIIPNSGSPFQNGLRGETFSVRDLGGREYNPQIGVQNEFIIPNPNLPFQNGLGSRVLNEGSLGGEEYNTVVRAQNKSIIGEGLGYLEAGNRETEYERVAEGNYPTREGGYRFADGGEEYERREGFGNEGFVSNYTSSSFRSPFESYDIGINGNENMVQSYQPVVQQREARYEQEEFYGSQNTTPQYGNKRIRAESEGAIGGYGDISAESVYREESNARERDGGEGSWSGFWKSESGLNPASTSSLVSGYQNVESSVAKTSWFSISNELKWEPAGGYDKYFTKDKIQEIINLKSERLTHPSQLSKILNKAPNKGPNSPLEQIINGWGNELGNILQGAIDKVGNNYPSRNKKGGSQEISLIFNALSKLDDDGTRLSIFYDEVTAIPEKWKEILLDATSQGTAIISNALSKIPGDGNEMKAFYDIARISENWDQNLKDSSAQNISNILGALSKIKDNGKKVSEFYGEVGGLKGLKKIFPRVIDKDIDFFIISKIMIALNGIEDGGPMLVKELYNSTKQDYTKTGERLSKDYNFITNSNAILLDLHGFSHDAAKIVIELFLNEVEGRGNPFYIECGKGGHSKLANKDEMSRIASKALIERQLPVNDGWQKGCFMIQSAPSPDAEKRIASTKSERDNSYKLEGDNSYRY
jgi:hypothetical protein